MKPVQLLPFCVAPAAASLESVMLPLNRAGVDFGMCVSPLTHGHGSLPDPVCSMNPVVPKYTYESVVNGSGSGWSTAAPCYKAARKDAVEHCMYHSKSFANGRGISILTTRERAEHVSKSDAFGLSQAELATRNILNRKARVMPIPGKEYGLVATERITRGERIMSETASLMVDYGAFEDVPQSTLNLIQMAGVDYLPDAHRRAYLNMSTAGQKLPYAEKIDKILTTNAFDVELDDEGEDNYYAIFIDSKSPPTNQCVGVAYTNVNN